MTLEFEHGTLTLKSGGRVLLSHHETRPCCFVGTGTGIVKTRKGHADLRDDLEEKIALRAARLQRRHGCECIDFSMSADGPVVLSVEISPAETGVQLRFQSHDARINRLWWRVPAEADEYVWGCGEQFSYFNLRGRHFPLWTSEPGVGRDKSTHITWQAEIAGGGGGDYYKTYYPQPTFVSSRRYALHAQTTAYADFDFRRAEHHELHFWAVPEQLEFTLADDFTTLVEHLSTRFGRQPRLPEWLHQGAVLGLKNGRRHADHVLALALEHGVQVSALWCEDWAGVRKTSFGTRLFWDWRWNEERYPDHARWVQALRGAGIRFMGYANPYLCEDGQLFKEARELGYLVRDKSGAAQLVDFGEFMCASVDFTNPAAARWFSERILVREMLDQGHDGWMADFGEYLPVDARLASGADPMLAHNAFPPQWAEVNAQAVASTGKTGEVVFFMRSGYTGVQAHCPMLWAGDQSVDFSRHDGLQTVICAALSAGLVGNAYHHSDIGGYTSLFGNTRTPEVFQRWAEMAAFTPMMRTHEGNRPEQNFQFYQDVDVLRHLARMTRLHVALSPYVRELVEEAAQRGLPLQRPLFLHYADDRSTYDIQDQYLYGESLLVAPVHTVDVRTWHPYLPAGANWVHLWSGEVFAGGMRVEVRAELGEPPVFVLQGSRWQDYLLSLPASMDR
ncbi:alpha-glucosidase [Paraburkholderia dipogonis]|uniref:alpha-glucosidase n=1 Tax=Paraburkholderia dipogonis TaxID=1211383 RepID=UPI0038BB1699